METTTQRPRSTSPLHPGVSAVGSAPCKEPCGSVGEGSMAESLADSERGPLVGKMRCWGWMRWLAGGGSCFSEK